MRSGLIRTIGKDYTPSTETIDRSEERGRYKKTPNPPQFGALGTRREANRMTAA